MGIHEHTGEQSLRVQGAHRPLLAHLCYRPTSARLERVAGLQSSGTVFSLLYDDTPVSFRKLTKSLFELERRQTGVPQRAKCLRMHEYHSVDEATRDDEPT
jgi:hypothetical protein